MKNVYFMIYHTTYLKWNCTAACSTVSTAATEELRKRGVFCFWMRNACLVPVCLLIILYDLVKNCKFHAFPSSTCSSCVCMSCTLHTTIEHKRANKCTQLYYLYQRNTIRYSFSTVPWRWRCSVFSLNLLYVKWI